MGGRIMMVAPAKPEREKKKLSLSICSFLVSFFSLSPAPHYPYNPHLHQGAGCVRENIWCLCGV